MNHFTPFCTHRRSRTLAANLIVALCVIVWSAAVLIGLNSLAGSWHAASSIGRNTQIGGR